MKFSIFPQVFSLSVIFSSLTYAASDGRNNQNLMEEVLVSARKQQENLQEVPIAVSVWGQERLSKATVNDIGDIVSFAPNIDFSRTAPFSGSSNAATVFIRGVGQGDFLLTTDSGVGMYLDGIYIARSIGSVIDLLDLERVEVLRGPQGTLFGKNTIGGAINLISRIPSEEYSAVLSATVGSDQRRDVRYQLEGALAENLSARIALQSQKRDGYVKRIIDGKTLGDIDSQALRGQLFWQPSDLWQVAVNFDASKQRQESIGQTVLYIADSTIPMELFNTFVAPQFSTQWDSRWITGSNYSTYQTGPSQDDADNYGASISVSWQRDGIELVSLTGYRKLRAQYSRDPDGSPLTYGHSTNTDDHWQFSQELRLHSSALEGSLEWQLGAYYFQEHGKNRAEILLFSGLYEATGLAALDFDFNLTNDIKTTSTALFGSANYQLAQNWRLSAGLRVTRENKDFYVANRYINAETWVFPPADTSARWNNISPTVTVDYQAFNNTMLYATLSEGFKSGGFNGRQLSLSEVEPFAPEKVVNREIGLKSTWWEGALTTNAAIFQQDYRDMQFTVLTLDEAGFEIPVIDNAARAKIQGAELEIAFRSSNGFNLSAGLGYLDARYTKLNEGVVIEKSSRLVRAPRWTASVHLSQKIDMQQWGSMDFSLGGTFKSKLYNDPLNTEIISQPSHALWNTSVQWQPTNEKWQLTGFVTNLGDKAYLMSGSADLEGFGGAEGNFGRPREWGVELEYRL